LEWLCSLLSELANVSKAPWAGSSLLNQNCLSLSSTQEVKPFVYVLLSRERAISIRYNWEEEFFGCFRWLARWLS
jgi:hypothetical protein